MADLFTEVFNWLPLAHLIDSKALVSTPSPPSPSFIPQVMHGGLFSTDDVTLDDLRKIDRNRQPPEEGITTVGGRVLFTCDCSDLIG